MREPLARISVVVPSCNSSRTLVSTLDGLLSLEGNDLAEILVVDSSDDGMMPPVVERYRRRGVRFLDAGRRVMPAIGRNLGAKEAVGNVLAFIDADAYPETDWGVRIAENHRSGKLAGGGSVLLPEWQEGLPVAVAQYYLQFNESLPDPSGRQETRPFLPSVNLYCDRSLFERAGGFPEIRAGEDTLFGIRLSRIAPIWFDPGIRVRHIFRDRVDDFCRNQRMLGHYNLVFRRTEYGSAIYRGRIPALLSPAITILKGMRIVSRVAGAGNGHLARLATGFPLFARGLAAWGAGFASASSGAAP